MSERRDDGPSAPEPDHPLWNIVDWFPPDEWGEGAWRGFQRDSCALLKESRGQWAAYHGEARVGVDRDLAGLYAECLRQGFPPAECVICRIEPVAEQAAVGLGLSRVEYGD